MVSFDRERQREFTLSVTATDQADEPLIGICQITVLIADQNDNDPKFENSRYQCEYRQHGRWRHRERPAARPASCVQKCSSLTRPDVRVNV